MKHILWTGPWDSYSSGGDHEYDGVPWFDTADELTYLIRPQPDKGFSLVATFACDPNYYAEERANSVEEAQALAEKDLEKRYPLQVLARVGRDET